jgi:hypothetical protein
MDESWTIVELAELAAEALARPGTVGPEGSAGSDWRLDGGTEGGTDGGPARANGRVRDVPNERLIRWYGTVGLVDPPLSRRGRVARYGRRHLLQLVAVKRRQAEGKSLAEIQAELAGATDDALAAVARVPAASRQQASAALAPAPDTGPGRFWARDPRRLLAEAAPADEAAVADKATTANTAQARAGVPTAGLVRGIRLAPGVTLLLDNAGREPRPQDLTGIVTAAGPLLRELASRGLIASALDHPAEAEVEPFADGSRE